MSDSVITATDAPPFTCPRRIEQGRADPDSPLRGSGTDLDGWRIMSWPDAPGIINSGVRSCDYCGSMHPDDFMAAIEAGHQVGPTDKRYKAYLEYVPHRVSRGKFYYQHLSRTQMEQFVTLYNGKRINIGYPGNFYALPFFMSRS